ncbi:hypothetical protein J6590_053071 [Homalodisca vitripennis]|nr:hypothetical protein J6590_053071 [Homalodisca vitripennis]
MAIVNSWLTYRDDCFKAAVPKTCIMDLHFFKLRIAQLLIIEKTVPEHESDSENDVEEPPRKRQAGRPGRVSLPLQEKRVQGAMHLPQAMDLKEAQRCRNPGCSGKTRIQCTDAKAAEAAQSAYYDPNRPQCAYVPPPAYYVSIACLLYLTPIPSGDKRSITINELKQPK